MAVNLLSKRYVKIECLLPVADFFWVQAGKYRQQGKPYEMVDGDIAYWKSGQ